MLVRAEARTDRGALLSLIIGDFSNGYEVRDIGGLDPVSAVLVSSSFANQDGETYQSARRDKRNIILDLGIHANHVDLSVTELRKTLYEFFMPKNKVNFRFISDDLPTVEISGRVETMDSPRFTKDPKANISVVCFDPDFLVLTPVVVPGNTTSGTTEMEIDYEGTVETGALVKININRTVSDFTIFQRLADNSVRTLEFESPTPMVAGDVLEISTTPGSKGAWLTRAGVRTSVLYAIAPSSAWISLDPGVNNFRIFTAGAAIPYTIEYTIRLGGL